MNVLKLDTDLFLTRAFLLCFSLLPVLNLFWQTDFGFIKGNWLLYPVIICSAIISLLLRRKITFLLIFILLAALFYIAYFVLKDGQFESILRFFFTLLPFAFLKQIREYQYNGTVNLFLWIYLLAIIAPIYFSYLQLTGRVPYYEYDVVDGQWVGRISGGYSKPNNFVAILFPLFLLGLYKWLIQKKQILGFTLILFVLIAVYITGLRTAVFIYALIVLAAFVPQVLRTVILFYYRYYLNFFVPITTLVVMYLLFHKYGYIDEIRGRVPMWQAHSREFFYNSNLIEILFGKAKVLLPIKYDSAVLVGSLIEAHNNSFRTIVTFGVLGFLFYCTVVRWIVLQIDHFTVSAQMKFIYFACCLFLILYSITNEPAYYSSIFWSIFIWIFLNPSAGKEPLDER